MQCSAPHLAAWCAADPGSIVARSQVWVPALRRTAEEALHRVRDTATAALSSPRPALAGRGRSRSQRVGAKRRPMINSAKASGEGLLATTHFVVPGRAKREPGIHNHDREHGFPDVQLHI
jgi:hypothetical protein